MEKNFVNLRQIPLGEEPDFYDGLFAIGIIVVFSLVAPMLIMGIMFGLGSIIKLIGG